ncbi:MAG: hypothetical protein FJZ56_05280 [Chlamydiae bacterium]|nr:hypothetical protein [Chlamydiota bacterium]
MIPYIFAAVGGYLIGQSQKKDVMANGGNVVEKGGYMAKGGSVDPNRYPELRKIADKIADDTAEKINKEVKDVKSEMPYKAQWVLEEVVRDLENRI